MRPRERICVAIDRGTKKSAQINVTNYLCPVTKRQVVVNNTMAPFSPYSGRTLRQIAKAVVQLPVREIIADLVNVGDCPTCEGSHYMFKPEAKKLHGQNLHCVVCNSEFPVSVDLSTTDAQNEQQSEEQRRQAKRTPEDDGNSEEDRELIHAAADDDDDDDNDNNDDDADGDNDGDNAGAVAGDDDNDDDDGDENAGDNTEAEPEDNKVAPAAAEVTAPGAATPQPNNPAPAASPPVAEEPAAGSETSDTSGKENDLSGDDDDDDDNDDDDGDDVASELVSATSKELLVNCFNRAGGLVGKEVQFIAVSASLGLILADNQPVISLEADKAGDNKKLFAEPDALTRAVKAIIDNEENPTPESFASLGGAAITFTMPVADAIKRRIESGVTAIAASFAERRKTMFEEMRQCLSTATLIVNRGADRDTTNPLYDTLVASLKKVNVRGAENIVNAAFVEASDKYIATVLAKANELYAQPLETRNQIARFVEKVPFTTAASSDESDGNTHREQFKRGSMPLSTAKEEADPPVREVTAGATNPNVDHYRALLRR